MAQVRLVINKNKKLNGRSATCLLIIDGKVAQKINERMADVYIKELGLKAMPATPSLSRKDYFNIQYI